MKRFALPILAVSLVAFAPLATAQLDETAAQVEARYGQSTDQWDDDEVPGAKCFHCEKDGLEIEVAFGNDHVASVSFSTLNTADFGDEEVQALLDANKGTSSWGAPEYEKKLSADGKPEASLDRTDNGASASYWYDEEDKRLTFDIETEAYLQARGSGRCEAKTEGQETLTAAPWSPRDAPGFAGTPLRWEKRGEDR